MRAAVAWCLECVTHVLGVMRSNLREVNGDS